MGFCVPALGLLCSPPQVHCGACSQGGPQIAPFVLFGCATVSPCHFPKPRLLISALPAFPLAETTQVIVACLISHADPPLSQVHLLPSSLPPLFPAQVHFLPSFLLLTLLCISDILYIFCLCLLHVSVFPH